mmetsp:Transcript_11536/g.21399  ORF Transcript_11536/g.21399 Transcript_11536/m.21399 type:complete len:803 (-) Transcript_11536:190-2598(-)
MHFNKTSVHSDGMFSGFPRSTRTIGIQTEPVLNSESAEEGTQFPEQQDDSEGRWTTIAKRQKWRPQSADGNSSKHGLKPAAGTPSSKGAADASSETETFKSQRRRKRHSTPSATRRPASMSKPESQRTMHQGDTLVRSDSACSLHSLVSNEICSIEAVADQITKLRTNDAAIIRMIERLEAKIDKVSLLLEGQREREQDQLPQDRSRSLSTAPRRNRNQSMPAAPSSMTTGGGTTPQRSQPPNLSVPQNRDWRAGAQDFPPYTVLQGSAPPNTQTAEHFGTSPYNVYYDTTAAGVLFTDPYFCPVPEQHQVSSPAPSAVMQQEVLRRRLGRPLPHEWHGREFCDSAVLNAAAQDQLTHMYRTRSARDLISGNGISTAASAHLNAQFPLSLQMRPRRFIESGAYRLRKEILRFVEDCFLKRKERLQVENVTLARLVTVVRHLWPRATVKPFGSCATRLALPAGDMDLVICLPKVMQDDIADEPGPLEGRNAIKLTWQQNLAESLQLAPWVDADSVKTILYAPIPVIKLSTVPQDSNECALDLDISFQSENHKGIHASKLVTSLCAQLPALTPLVLVLKQFLAKRKLGKGYTGGLSSYGMLLLAACFLRHVSQSNIALSPRSAKLANRSRSNSHGPFGVSEMEFDQDHAHLLVRFLLFFGDARLFDPSRTGVSLSRGFFDRKSGTETTQNSVSDTVSLPGTRPRVDVAMRQRHQLQRHENYKNFRYPIASTDNAGYENFGSYESTQDSHRFDPLFIDDPLLPGNNVGRNCFRFSSIQREMRDAGEVLQRSILEGCPDGTLARVL